MRIIDITELFWELVEAINVLDQDTLIETLAFKQLQAWMQEEEGEDKPVRALPRSRRANLSVRRNTLEDQGRVRSSAIGKRSYQIRGEEHEPDRLKIFDIMDGEKLYTGPPVDKKALYGDI